MGQALLLVERYILESIMSGAVTLEALENSTGLNSKFLNGVLSLLEDRKIVSNTFGSISLDKENKNDWVQSINSSNNLEQEIGEFLTTWSKAYFRDKELAELKLKKVHLNESDSKLLNILMNNLDEFVLEIEKRNRLDPKPMQTSEKSIIIWGKTRYKNLLKQTIQ